MPSTPLNLQNDTVIYRWFLPDSKIYLYIRATNPVEALMSLVLKGLEETPDSKVSGFSVAGLFELGIF